jgi:hypothetical protein
MLDLLIVAGLLLTPIPTAPPDDPDFAHCLDPDRGIYLEWGSTDSGVTTYVLVKRRYENDDWKTWVKSYVKKSPFTINMHSHLARNGDFAWVLFGVDRAGAEYTIGDWHYFCTRG